MGQTACSQGDWEAMLPAGFNFYKRCTCGGVLKYKYKGPNSAEVHVVPGSDMFRMWRGAGREICSGLIKDMKHKLHEATT